MVSNTNDNIEVTPYRKQCQCNLIEDSANSDIEDTK